MTAILIDVKIAEIHRWMPQIYPNTDKSLQAHGCHI